MRAVFVDAGGTLIRPRQPVGVSYARVAREHGGTRAGEQQSMFDVIERAASTARAGLRSSEDARDAHPDLAKSSSMPELRPAASPTARPSR